VAKVIRRAQELSIQWPLTPEVTDSDLEKAFFPKTAIEQSRKYPDFEYVHKELLKQGVTLKLLWEEYCEECRVAKEIPLMYSQFCNLHLEYAETKKAAMHIPRKPGDILEVDWAGTKMHIIDRETGELISVSIFVAALAYSQYGYVEAFLTEKTEDWITAHVNTYRYLGGVTRILVPDNLKTGVNTPADKYSPEINKVYREMSEHYGTAIIPARVRKPKDKPNAEGAVGITTTWIIAALRDQKFFSLQDLNQAIRAKLELFNNKPFQKKEGSRRSIFLAEEKPFLLPLPASQYEMAEWKTAMVQFNYHIYVGKMYYSVPYEYIRQKVDVRITRNVIEVFYHNHRICSHARLYGRTGQYSTVEIHMPEDHQKYIQWNAKRFILWAEGIGTNTAMTVRAILDSNKIEQQGYRSCMGLLNLADRYSSARLESACKRALSYTPRPSYKIVKNILATGWDKVNEETTAVKDADDHTESFGFTRGPEYYDKGKH
jgi:transposase